MAKTANPANDGDSASPDVPIPQMFAPDGSEQPADPEDDAPDQDAAPDDDAAAGEIDEPDSPAGDDEAEAETAEETDDDEPESRFSKLLQKEQMKRANFERKIEDRLTGMRDEILEAIRDRGGKPTSQQQAAVDDLDDMLDEGDPGDDDADDEYPVSRKELKASQERLVAQAREQVQAALAEERQRAERDAAEQQAYELAFDEHNPEHMQGKGREVLRRYREQAAQLSSLSRMSKDDREKVCRMLFDDAYAAVEADALEKRTRGNGQPPSRSSKSPEGAEVVKSGAQTGRAVGGGDRPSDGLNLPQMWVDDK